MPRPIEPLPPPGALASWCVGQQVSGGLFEGIAEALAFLCGRNLPQILSATDLAPLDTQDVYVIYQRTPACRALAIAIELQGDAAGGRSTVNITLDTGSGSIAWYPTLGTSESNGQLDGSSELPATNTVQRDYPIFEGVLDVSNLTVGAVSVLRFSSGNVSSSGGKGIFSLSIWEVPLAACDPVASPSDEIGVDPGWLVGGNGIVAGSETSPRGIGRIFREADRARGEVPRHWQICTPEGAAWTQSASGTGAFSWGSRFTSLDHVWRIRARKLYPDAGNRVRFLARYAWNGTTAAVIRVIADTTNLGGATTTTAEIELAATGGSAVYEIASVELELPVDGDDQEVEISFEADAGDDDVSITTLALIEREVEAPAVLSEAVFWWEVDDLELTGNEIDQWNDKTGNGRHAVLYSAGKAVLSGGKAVFGNAPTIYSLAHESALEPDSWSLFASCSFPNSTLEWFILKSSSGSSDFQTDGWGFREIFSGADHAFLTAFDSAYDQTSGTRTVGAGATFYNEPTEWEEIASYLVVYDGPNGTLTITDSRGNTLQKTGVSLPRTTCTDDVMFGGSVDSSTYGYDGDVYLTAFFDRALSTEEGDILFEYARSAHGAL